jgi:hypothetical protein
VQPGLQFNDLRLQKSRGGERSGVYPVATVGMGWQLFRKCRKLKKGFLNRKRPGIFGFCFYINSEEKLTVMFSVEVIG